jgi:hypothetical protein
MLLPNRSWPVVRMLDRERIVTILTLTIPQQKGSKRHPVK